MVVADTIRNALVSKVYQFVPNCPQAGCAAGKFRQAFQLGSCDYRLGAAWTPGETVV